MNQSDSKRSSVRLPKNVNDLVEQIQDNIAENLNGFRPNRAYVLAEAMRIGLENLVLFGSEKITLGQSEPKKERKKEAKKERKNTPLQDTPKLWTDKIQELRDRLGHHELISRALEAIASTRKNGTLSDSVIYGILTKWATVEQPEALAMGLEKYLERDHAADGKREEYAWGIIRGCIRELEAKPSGGNGKPKPDPTIPTGYPADIYDGRNWRWSSHAGSAGGWYPVGPGGKVDTGAQYWPWVEGMRKGR